MRLFTKPYHTAFSHWNPSAHTTGEGCEVCCDCLTCHLRYYFNLLLGR